MIHLNNWLVAGGPTGHQLLWCCWSYQKKTAWYLDRLMIILLPISLIFEMTFYVFLCHFYISAIYCMACRGRYGHVILSKSWLLLSVYNLRRTQECILPVGLSVLLLSFVILFDWFFPWKYLFLDTWAKMCNILSGLFSPAAFAEKIILERARLDLTPYQRMNCFMDLKTWNLVVIWRYSLDLVYRL